MSVIQGFTGRDVTANVTIPTAFTENVLIDVYITTIWIRNVIGIIFVSVMMVGLVNTALNLRNVSILR